MCASLPLFRWLVGVAGICPARQQTLRPTPVLYYISVTLSTPKSFDDCPYLIAESEGRYRVLRRKAQLKRPSLRSCALCGKRKERQGKPIPHLGSHQRGVAVNFLRKPGPTKSSGYLAHQKGHDIAPKG